MEFSKNYLFKYGWKEGEGLGKTNDGIKDAIRPKLKFDKAGIGFDPSLEFTDNWWEQIYNNAAKTKEKKIKRNCSLDAQTKGEEKDHVKDVSEHLFKACGGRTAHKGARHGLKLNGKLQRLEEQEKRLINRCNAFEITETGKELSEKEDSKKKGGNSLVKRQSELNADHLVDSSHTSNAKKKRCHKKSAEMP